MIHNHPSLVYTRPSFVPGDTLMNPYAPPLQQPIVMPINVPTNVGYRGNESFRQVGILTPMKRGSHDEKILVLMGRPLFSNRDKWQYYTMSDQFNSIKLPILVKKRSAMNEYGVDSLSDNDVVFVQGYKQAFKATIYDNYGLSYLEKSPGFL
jgi:hypothetical protein